MQLKSKKLSVDLVVVMIVSLTVAWAFWYVADTQRQVDGAEAVLFIKPLSWIILGTAILVLIGSTRLKSRPLDADSADEIKEESGAPGSGLSDWRRLLLILSLPVYGIAISFLGFMIPSLSYAGVMFLSLGVRQPLLFICLLAGIAVVIKIGFVQLLGVPLPLWPRFLAG